MKERERATIRFHYNFQWNRMTTLLLCRSLLCLGCGSVLLSTPPHSPILAGALFCGLTSHRTPLPKGPSLSSPFSGKLWLLVSHPQTPPISMPLSPLAFHLVPSAVANRWSFSRSFSLSLSLILTLSPSRCIGTFGVRQKYQHDTGIQLKIHPRTRRTDWGDARVCHSVHGTKNTVYICVLWNIFLVGNLEKKTCQIKWKQSEISKVSVVVLRVLGGINNTESSRVIFFFFYGANSAGPKYWKWRGKWNETKPLLLTVR